MSQLVELIKNWEKFNAAEPNGTVDDFAIWLSNKLNRTEGKAILHSKTTEKETTEFHGDDETFDKYPGNQKTSMQAAYLLSRMNQYISFYTKPMMRKHGLHSLDDFGYLQNLQHFGNITKTKACDLMMQEYTTGVDIIKRLIRNGFVKEKVAKEDKRAKLIGLTAKGQKVLDNMYHDFLELPDTLGTMKDKERQTLLQWLMLLDEHHNAYVKAIFRK